MISKTALFNLVLKLSLLIANEATSGCEKPTRVDVVINPNKTTIDKRIGDSVTIECTAKEHPVKWKHIFGIKSDVRRVFNQSSITLSNITYFDIGTYSCTVTTDQCLQKEVVLNVQGAPFVIRKNGYIEISEKMKTLTLDIISFPPPNLDVAVRLCNEENKNSIFNVSLELRLITVSLDNTEYSIGGYSINLTSEIETLTRNGLYCIDISNEYGKTSFLFYRNISDTKTDSTNERTLLVFLEENMTAITLGGLGLLTLIFTLTIFVMCRKLKTVENKRLSNFFHSMGPGASNPSSYSFKMTHLSNNFFQDPTPCQTGTFTTRNVELRDRLYDPNGITKSIPQRMDSRVYSFGQSEPDEYEDSF